MAEVRKRGVPTAVVCSTPFERLAKNQARVLGVPDLPLLMITHPLGGIGMDEVRARAAMALPGLVDLIRRRIDD